jgi:excinuclease UvrABC ATPase subunit
MAHADWIIDLGPGAGHDGGRIVFEGTPSELVADRSTLTGEHLAAYVSGAGSGKGAQSRAGVSAQ